MILSPCGNISCQTFTDEQPGYPRCYLIASNISPAAQDCHGTGIWGKSMTLQAGKPAEMRRISDTVADPSKPVLHYDQSTSVTMPGSWLRVHKRIIVPPAAAKCGRPTVLMRLTSSLDAADLAAIWLT